MAQGKVMFTQVKLAQMAAYIAAKIGQPRVNYMRLMKLMYMADREAMAAYGEPISFDSMYSMDNGLVLSETYDVLKSPRLINELEPWSRFFTVRRSESDYTVGVREFPDREVLDYLSDADIAVLDATMQKFGHMSQWDLSEYHHKQCPEWDSSCGRSSTPVNDSKILEAIGVPKEQLEQAAQNVMSERGMNRIFRRR